MTRLPRTGRRRSGYSRSRGWLTVIPLAGAGFALSGRLRDVYGLGSFDVQFVGAALGGVGYSAFAVDFSDPAKAEPALALPWHLNRRCINLRVTPDHLMGAGRRHGGRPRDLPFRVTPRVRLQRRG